MKNNFIVLFLLTLTVFSYAQSKDQNDYIIISGKIENVKEKMDGKKTIDLSYPHYLNKGREVIVIPLSEDGSFNDTINSEAGLYVIFDTRNIVPIYLKKSKQYSIAYNAEDFSSRGNVQYGGADSQPTFIIVINTGTENISMQELENNPKKNSGKS